MSWGLMASIIDLRNRQLRCDLMTVTFRIIWRSISELIGFVVTVTTRGPTRNLRTLAKIS